MVTLAFVFILIGFLCFYVTSHKTELTQWSNLQKWCQNNSLQTKMLGGIALIISCSLAIVAFGLGAGILAFVVFLMTIGCLIILLGPIQIISSKILVSMGLLCLIFELFLL